MYRLISDCYDAAIGSSCDSVGGVDSVEYAGMCPHHLTAAHVYQGNLSNSQMICHGEMR